MFDIGFSELFVIAVVALLVLGPERLPKAARFAGLWVRRARAQWYSVKAELENELADEELKRSLRQAQEQLRAAEAALREQATGVEQGVRGVTHQVETGLTGAQAGTASGRLDATPIVAGGGAADGTTGHGSTIRPAEEHHPESHPRDADSGTQSTPSATPSPDDRRA
jgi:sec-independent protein translocase protein TatB